MAPIPAAGQYADVNGIKMYYELHGAGHPLVLLHGGGSTIHTTFGAILPQLAESYRVIAVELQAHGHTGDRDAPETFEQDADDVAMLLSQLGITGADIFGFSNGGTTAMQVAIRHPERVRRLVLASASYKREGIYPWFWEGFNNAQLSDMPQVYKDEYLKINNDPAALLNMFNKDVQRMRDFCSWQDADIMSIQVPVLIAAGDQDITRPEHAVEMFRLLPHARLAILPGTHGSYMGEIAAAGTDSKVPQLFIAILKEFLAAPENSTAK